MRAVLVAAALAAVPAGAEVRRLSPVATLPALTNAFARVCVVGGSDAAAQRSAATAHGFRRSSEAAGSEGEAWASYPLSLTLVDRDGWTLCTVTAPLAAGVSAAEAAAAIRAIAGDGSEEVNTGQFVTWDRQLNGEPQRIRLTLSAAPGGQTAVVQLAAKKAG
ncbi:MAG: hypothetical protein RQ833_11965 [Sphingomonadaceae bacterium]|nr:hypothetical protein [Sphingomonadaceae bacterium]